MSLCVRTVVVFGFLLELTPEQADFIQDETAASIHTTSYRADEPEGYYLVGEELAKSSNVGSARVLKTVDFKYIEEQLREVLKGMGITPSEPAQTRVVSYYF